MCCKEDIQKECSVHPWKWAFFLHINQHAHSLGKKKRQRTQTGPWCSHMNLLTQVHVPLSDCNITKMWADPCTNPEKGCLVYKGALSSHKTLSQTPSGFLEMLIVFGCSLPYFSERGD